MVLMRRVVTVCLFGLLAGAGCDAGMRVGDLWVVSPRAPLSASQFQMTRYQIDADDARVHEKRLVVDLSTGRASLTDSDGRVYASQLSAEILEQVRATISGGSWNFSRAQAAPHAEEVQYFELSVHNGDDPVGGLCRWAVPAARELRPAHILLVKTFDRAHRMAHPLSDQVNLVE